MAILVLVLAQVRALVLANWRPKECSNQVIETTTDNQKLTFKHLKIMKKILISMMAVAVSVSAMAASTATANIKLVGTNTTYAVSTLQMNEDDARTNAYESGYDAESMMNQSNPHSVLLYAYLGTQPCEILFANNLENQKISLKTNMVDADYTLQFSNVSGRALKLYDNVTDTYTDITEGGSYAFSVEAAQVGRKEIKDRFEIRLAPAAPSFCFRNNILEINGHEGESLVITEKATGADIVTETLDAEYQYSFDGKSGRFIVTLNGQAYHIDASVVPDPVVP